MGWSIDLIMTNIDRIFGDNLHEVSIPESARPYAVISYDEELSLVDKKLIADLFPEGWYIYFHAGTLHHETGITS